MTDDPFMLILAGITALQGFFFWRMMCNLRLRDELLRAKEKSKSDDGG